MQSAVLSAAAAALLALACVAGPAAAHPHCLDFPAEADPASVAAFMSGVLVHFAYPTSVSAPFCLLPLPPTPGWLPSLPRSPLPAAPAAA